MPSYLKPYIGIFLISLATLALEILQVRVFSVMLWHHLSYMVITITLLGFSAAGAYVAIKGAGDDTQALNTAGWAALLSGITTVIGFAVVTRIPLDTYMEMGVVQLSFIFLYYAFLIVPYFFMGLTITILLTRFVKVVHRLYFWNLIGSALGCLLFLWLLLTFGGEGSILIVAALASAAAIPLFPKKSLVGLAVVVTVVLLVLSTQASTILTVRPAASKALGEFMANVPDLKIERSQWDPIARIDVSSSPSFGKIYRYHDAEVQKIFTIDGDAYTFVYRFDKPWPEVDLIGKTLYSSAYFFKEKPKVAVIGLGGGTDIMTALHHEARDITGVEINQAMIDAANYAFQDYKYQPYQDPSVTIVHEEGRSYLRRVQEKYDIIQMSGVDTWSALATGAYVLSENYLYTREAFQEYYEHLNKDGILCMIRWIFSPPRECLRLVTIQSDILKENSFAAPWDHFLVLRQGTLASVVTKMSAFTRRDIQRLKRQLSDKPDLEILYAPGMAGDNMFYRYFAAMKENREQEFIAQYPFKLDPVYDDRPFFFEFYKWKDTFKTYFDQGGYLVAARPIGYIILLASLVQAVFFGLIFILFPLYKFKRRGLSMVGSRHMIAYFAALGMGFMFVEVSLMQKFVLFLGHPTYSITVTLFTLLTFSGIGSFIAGRIVKDPRRLILRATQAIAAMVILYSFILTPTFNALLGLPLWGRTLAAVLVLAPLGILMGMPFPTGLSYVRRGAASFVPWAFGINGVASVAASVICIILALVFGFNIVLYLAAIIYFVGGLILHRLSLRDTPIED